MVAHARTKHRYSKRRKWNLPQDGKPKPDSNAWCEAQKLVLAKRRKVADMGDCGLTLEFSGWQKRSF
jgi:hypothetical protein